MVFPPCICGVILVAMGKKSVKKSTKKTTAKVKRQGSRFTKAEVIAKKAIISELRAFGLTVADCCGVANINPDTYHAWRKADAKFRQNTAEKGSVIKEVIDGTLADGVMGESRVMRLWRTDVENAYILALKGKPYNINPPPLIPTTTLYAKTKGGADGVYAPPQQNDRGIDVLFAQLRAEKEARGRSHMDTLHGLTILEQSATQEQVGSVVDEDDWLTDWGKD